MLGVLCALRDLGHEVSVATHASFHEHVKAFGLTAVSAGLSEAELLDERLRRWPETADEQPAEWAPRMFTEIAAPAMATDLRRATAGATPNLVICEEGEYGGPAFAASMGIDWISHVWGSPRVDRPHARPAMLSLDPCPRSLQPTTALSGSSWPLRLIPPRLAEVDDAVARWLQQRDRPVAYVSFGTVPLYADAPLIATDIVERLLMHSFDVITTSPTSIADSRVYYTPFLELTDVLPACNLVICHGGAGTTLAALAHGLPMLLLPRGAPSQQRMAAACARAGAAEMLGADPVITAELLDDALSESHRKAAAHLAREIASAPTPFEIAQRLVRLGRANGGPS